MSLPLHGYPDWQQPLATADLESVVSTQVLAPGGLLQSSILDMRSYSSYRLGAYASLAVAPTAFGSAEILLEWTADAAGTVDIWRTDMAIHPYNLTASPFDVPYDALYVQGPIAGPYLRVSCVNNGPDNINASFRIYGASRTLPSTSLRQSVASGIGPPLLTDTLLTSGAYVLAVGATQTIPIPIAPGLSYLDATIAAAPVTITVTGPTGQLLANLAAVGTTRQLLMLPAQSGIVRLTNAGGVPATIAFILTSVREYQ